MIQIQRKIAQLLGDNRWYFVMVPEKMVVVDLYLVVKRDLECRQLGSNLWVLKATSHIPIK